MCRDYVVPAGTFPIGQKVKVNKSICGWFDFSEKKEIPPETIGSIFKIEKMNSKLENVEYTVKFNAEFDFVKIKHGDLKNV
jgi:hypothetical protein